MASAAVLKEEAEENNNPPLISPLNTACSSPEGSMTSPPPSTQYLSPSPSPVGQSHHQHHHPTPLASNFSLFANTHHAGSTMATSASSVINHELSLLKPLTACPEKSVFPTSFFQKFAPSKISFSGLHPVEPLLRSTASPATSEQSRPTSPITEGEDKSPSVTMSSWTNYICVILALCLFFSSRNSVDCSRLSYTTLYRKIGFYKSFIFLYSTVRFKIPSKCITWIFFVHEHKNNPLWHFFSDP